MCKLILKISFSLIIVLFILTNSFAKCPGDFDNDGDLDGDDAIIISGEIGRADCLPATPCTGDIYPTVAPDGIVNELDLMIFAADFGRSNCPIQPETPLNLFNIGDSIGEGIAAYNDFFGVHHETVWSIGYDPDDNVYTLNERFEDTDPDGYYENDAARDEIFNHAIEGDEMVEFALQADAVVKAADERLSGKVGMITVFLGNNDVCTGNVGNMTKPHKFEKRYRAGLEILATNDNTKEAYIHISGIPDIYWLWIAKRDNGWCRFIWPSVPCQELLRDADINCESIDSDLDPDTIYANDSEECIRRKDFHTAIRDVYNPILRDVLQEYKQTGRLPNAYYIDIFDIKFGDEHINSGDCFHPSVEGHRVLAEEHWCRSPWNRNDPLCIPPE